MSQVKTRRAPKAPKSEAPVRGSMGTIADEHRQPVAKSTPQDQPVPVDAKLAGKACASEAINVAKGEMKQRAQWPTFGRRVRHLTPEGREVFIDTIAAFVQEMRKAEREAGAVKNAEGKPEPTKEQAKRAAAVVASATVELSKLRTIAAAWNDNATDAGLVQFYATMRTGVDVDKWSADDVPHAYVYQYAVSMSKAKAGRTPDRWGTMLAKFLERNAPRDEAGDTQADKDLRDRLVAMVAEHVATYPAKITDRDPLTRAELLGQ